MLKTEKFHRKDDDHMITTMNNSPQAGAQAPALLKPAQAGFPAGEAKPSGGMPEETFTRDAGGGVEAGMTEASIRSVVNQSYSSGASKKGGAEEQVKGALYGGAFGGLATGIPSSLASLTVKLLTTGNWAPAIATGAATVATGAVALTFMGLAAMAGDSPQGAEALERGMGKGQLLGIPVSAAAVGAGIAAGAGPFVLVPLGVAAFGATVLGSVGRELARAGFFAS
jgi:fluoride ion exporter CrcB/FEX